MPFYSSVNCETAIRKLKWNKAFAAPFAPGEAFGPFADSIAGKLFELLRRWWGQDDPFLPSSWKDSWMVWLNQTGESPDRPKNLRPLALQDPLGKSVMTLIAQALRNFAFDQLCAWPQWAYVNGTWNWRCTGHECLRTVIWSRANSKHMLEGRLTS